MQVEASNFSEMLREQLTKASEQTAGEPNRAAPVQQSTQVSVETVAAPVENAPAAKPPVDERMARVIQQAQQVRAEREAWKREQEQHKADLEELASFRELKQRAKDDPVAWAEAGGYKPDEYATTLVEKGAFTPEKRMLFEQRKELEALKSWKSQFQHEQQEQRDAFAYNQTVSALKNFADQAGEQYDIVRRTGAYDLVIQKFHQHYKQTEALGAPEELPWEMAFEQAENELLTRYEPVIESPKIKSRFGAAQASAPQSAPSSAPAVRSSGSISPRNRGNVSAPKELSEAESLEAAGRLLLKSFSPGR